MTTIRLRSEEIRRFVLDNVEDNSGNIASLAAKKFDISRQAINRHLKRLVDEECLSVEGKTRSRVYKLRPSTEWYKTFELSDNLEEDVVWRENLLPHLGEVPDNVNDIWFYAFTEMFNNAIDHSNGKTVTIDITQDSRTTTILIIDDGIGIFKKIQQELNLSHEREAVLELAKGKLTTDPDNHSGQGIFFTSRMMDEFSVFSGEIVFSHSHGKLEDWIHDRPKSRSGTTIFMKLNNHTSRTDKAVFDEYSTDDDFGFTKTVVPVSLAQHGDEKLVSRSQAKRVITRFEKFKVIYLDFENVHSIGQAFADEIFRVFAKRFPGIELIWVNASDDVEKMIQRALHTDIN